ncbi:MAG: J domain-containing protein [Salinarimonadaceae bacterium]|nr:MAG: J domain-containing protein [Salinarimonadaceae bacterium]
MDLKSPLFDRIRIKRRAEEPSVDEAPRCEHPGCKEPGTHRAPKGRGAEGHYWRFCLAHVREYNARYNYFSGMSDDALAAYQKDAIVGHRPTWSMGVNGAAKPAARRGRSGHKRDWDYADPLGVLNGEGLAARQRRKAPEPAAPRYSGPVRTALDVLGLDESADAPAIKAAYKGLVKRFHPDAHGGDRSFEERLREIIRAHDTLKAAGLC